MIDRYYFIRTLLLFTAITILSNCASVRSPEGGPLDDISPTLLGTNPEVLTNIKPEQKITIRFSEYLKESSLKNSFHVYPMDAGNIRHEFRGEKVDLWLPDNLNSGITYTLIIDTGLADEHGISIDKNISIPFTMDETFMSSTIEGHVYGNTNRANVLLWRGILDHEAILNKDPDYVANLTDNSYTFDYLPIDDFSILAVEQYGSNIDYTKGPYALYHEQSISTKNSPINNINFFMDKIPDPELSEADSLDVSGDNEDEVLKTATVSGRVSGKFLHPIKMLLQNDSHTYITPVNLDGSYVINNIVGGKYQLLIYEDRNNDNQFNTGSFPNKTYSEEFYIYPDSLSCRANWELELAPWSYQQEIEK